MPKPPATFLESAESLGIAFDDGDLDRFGAYLDALLEANTRFNLTAIRDPDEAWTRHILDALTLLPLVSTLADGDRVADVGSGGGAPGIPLAIASPQLQFTLVESTGKKAAFLREVVVSLGLEHVAVVNDRAETVGRAPDRRDQHAAATARALGPLRTALELVMPLVRPGGIGLFVKGAKADEEIEASAKALRELRCDVVDVVQTPTGRIVVVEKTAPTPRTYPRRPGEPKREPL